jgi:hypothetical protein
MKKMEKLRLKDAVRNNSIVAKEEKKLKVK